MYAVDTVARQKRKKRGQDTDFKFKEDDRDGKTMKSIEEDRVGG